MQLSFKRIGLLLEMERRTWGRTTLILSAILVSVIVLIFEFKYGFLNFSSSPSAFDMSVIAVPILTVFYLFYIYVLHRRVNRSKGLPYTVIPASIWEKSISLLIIGLIFYIIGALTVQACYLTELMLHPKINLLNRDIIFGQWVVFVGDFQLFDPVSNFFSWRSAISALSSVAIALFTAITFRRLRIGVGIYAAIFFGLFILIAVTAPLIPDSFREWIEHIRDSYTSEQIEIFFDNVHFVVNALPTPILGFFAYRNLKRKQI